MDSLEDAKSILKEFLNEQESNESLSQLELPIDLIDDSWVRFLPEYAKTNWRQLSIETRAMVQLLCIQLHDTNDVLEDYKTS